MHTEYARDVTEISIEEEMRTSYLDYSMSVIVGRALPDVRDGLKPVHRRILYAMYTEGLVASRKYSKCAGVVGEVLKKLHPHGDSAVYDALVRMAQPWNMRHPMIDGQGNFGSPDGDAAAAYRYTECRMTRLAEELLRDIDKETVDFQPNFDGADVEPTVLPASFPSLLVNGSEGIAVGMATRIPPHNLAEIINATVALIDDSAISDDDLLTHVPGPDFPTGGIIYGRAGIRDCYLRGRGKVTIRAATHVEAVGRDRQAIIIDELPFQVGADRVLEQVANLVRDKVVEGISAIRDESDRTGRRVVIELKRDEHPEITLNQLFKHTDLQVTFGATLLAIVNGGPQVLTLREALQHYISHRRDVVARRCRYELRKAKERAHILEGYRTALDDIDQVIRIIRESKDTDSAREALVGGFGFSEVQARHILDMQLRRLSGLERGKIEAEYSEILETIESLETTLASDVLLMRVVRDELIQVRDTYGDERRTRIVDTAADINVLDLIASEEQAITLTVRGYVKRTPLTQYQEQKRGGMGRKGMATRDEDTVQDIFMANTHSQFAVFTQSGKMFSVPVHELPEAGRDGRGRPLVQLMDLPADDPVASVLSLREFTDDLDLLFISAQGLVKRTALSEYKNQRAAGLRAYSCDDGDRLYGVVVARPDQDILILTRDGMSLRIRPYEEDENGAPVLDENGQVSLSIRRVGRNAKGSRGIRLEEGDEIRGIQVLERDPNMLLLTVTENGYGKRTALEEYRRQNRGGKGVTNVKVTDKNGPVVGAAQVYETDQVMLITDTGRVIKTNVSEIRETGRVAVGVMIMRLEKGERIVSVARVQDEDREDAPRPAPVPAPPAPVLPKAAVEEASVVSSEVVSSKVPPEVDEATLELVLNAIAARPDGAARSDVLAATGIPEALWALAAPVLLERGAVVKTGNRRSTRYFKA